jgi:hypothetical protein
MKLRSIAVLSVVLTLILAGCNNTPVTPIETKITPNVITLAKINSKGINPINSNDWLSPNWQEPEAWWRSLPTSQPPRSGLHAVVGWEILFDTRGNDSKFRQDLYRAGFGYDLTSRQNLRGLVTKAEITFSSAVLPSGAGVIALCQPITGAGGSLLVLAPSARLPVAALKMAYLGSANAATPYPSGSKIFSIPQGPFIPGTIANGVVMSPTGLGLAHFTVDVTAYVNAALERGATELSFMLTSSDEDAITAFPPSGHDCKTVYKFDELVIKHL